MGADQTAPSGTVGAGAGLKAEILLARDLAMTATAGRYNLADKAEAQRSVRDLTRLFFHLAEILEVDLFIEAGAKDAAMSRRAREVLDPRRVVAFEANPFTYRRFARVNAEATAVEYEHLALNDTPGTVTFHVRRAEDGSPIADGQASLLKRVDERATGFVEVSVDATTLDSYFREHDYRRSALWIDVEGASRPVLTGGPETLARAAVVVIEVEDRRYWGDEQWLRPDVLSYLYDRGLVPVARDFQSRYLYNIVLVRADLIDTVDRVRWAMTLFSSAAYAHPAPEPSGVAGPPKTPGQKIVARMRKEFAGARPRPRSTG